MAKTFKVADHRAELGTFQSFLFRPKAPVKTITIVGGGLAGLTLGLLLRRKNVPVKLYEAGSYPRHRVCGEYLSGRALSIIDSLGLRTPLKVLGAVESRDVVVARGTSALPHHQLPQPALCVSRYAFDQLLVEELSRAGGAVETRTRAPAEPSEGIVLATGRQPSTKQEGWRWFGLKAHARGVTLDAGLEMHLSPHGYVGLCRIEDQQVNVCGLFRSRHPIPDLAASWKRWLGGEPASLLHQRLCRADWDDSSFSSIAALSLAPRKSSDQMGLRLGDALTMIPPVTGNGMSMAIEGAHWAAGPISEWSRGGVDWTLTMKKVGRLLDQAFASRLRHASWLQHTMLDPFTQSVAWSLARLFPGFPSLLFRLTR